MPYTIITIICILNLRPLFAQPVQYPFSHLDISNGLSHNQVTSIIKDAKGFMWFGTASGLNRYDGYTFKVFRHRENDSTSLSDDLIVKIQEGPDNKFWVDTRSGQCLFDPVSEKAVLNTTDYCRKLSLPAAFVTDIVKDKQGGYWFAQTGNGATRYNPVTHAVKQYKRQPDVTDMTADNVGNVWMIYTDGVLEGYNTASGKMIVRHAALFKQPGELRYRLFADAENDLWIYTEGLPQGAFCYTVKNNNLIHYHRDAPATRLNNNLVTGIQQDNNGLIWISTDHGGVNLLNKRTGAIGYLENKPEDSKSISQNSINAIYRDNTGIIWLGTYKKGINYYHPNIIKFPVYQHLLSDAHSLPFDDVNRFVEDDKGNLWIGSNGGGLIYFDRSTGNYRTFKHSTTNSNSISNDVIVSLCIDHNKKLWIGSYYGGLDCYDGQQFIHYKNDPEDATSISDNSIWEIYEDAQHQLWVGTLSGGLNRFHPEIEGFYTYRKGNGSINSNYISALAEDQEGNLWVGTESGISVLNKKTGGFTYYQHDSKDKGSLGNGNVTALLKDSRGNMWVATRDGLNFFDKTTHSFCHFSQTDGLSENNILTLLEDNEHTLWLGTANGLSRAWVQYDAKGAMQVQFRTYDERDGLQGREFNENAVLKTKQGELIFGGANGFNIISPEAISHNTVVPEVVLTELYVFDKSPQPGEVINNRVLLQTAISEVKEITLRYHENIFSLEFAALNYSNPEKNQYAYKLEGFNNDWLTTDGTHRTVTYTNLDPGKYVFRVKASNGDGVWNEKGTALLVTILPPFWRTVPAFILYAILLGVILLAARRLTIQRAHMRFQLAQQKKEAERVHELDLLKLKFFTNVSHEFRTPLSLIMAPVEKLLNQSREGEQKKQYQLIYRNARRLLALVNQLLDFRKLEMRELRLYPSMGDIVSFVKEISCSFTDMAGAKHIQFNFTTGIDSLQISFDPDKLERILFNLLSNAFKFTPEHGSVQVQVAQEAQFVSITVKDSGIGIPYEDQYKIFERFFQHDVPGSILNQGSGIGLAISKEFVRLHQGTISVTSEPGSGTCFTVLLPVNKAVTESVVSQEELLLEQSSEESTEITGRASRKKPVVLIVDDNDDIRFYLKDNLRRNYTVYEAVNGAEGWEKTKQLQPDLIVSDVMMPVMDGMELCRIIKHDKQTSHIPVILLTARSAAEPKLEAFQVGANDYVTKPFSFEMLQSRIRNLLAQQEAMRKLFQKQVEVNPSEISITSVDEQFIRQAIETVEQHISSPEFSVEDLSRALHMSRVALYKKLLALTGKSPLDFIKTIRLKRAAQLLEKSQFTISEIAYEVGFNNPKYFARTFKKEFGLLPSAYAEQNSKS
ncbi:hybrid sensor histidine kinase/response regulator transcription factor [Niastella yeongjuensis]|uniref:hybrid sensor histidine kinase/response regulator transcription factor n=1 Tax=Niastella yeongjuensis TaxID=354355 RepID=UPI0008ABFE1B|nr:two-component regulator propeller domain-containing protein [Niastella yeongjuensis]SEP45526.1 Signal transduction histidine kinase [Niastella yeongjuensis]